MYKYIIALALVLSGCSQFSITGTMCDRIAADPFSTIPTECRPYNKKAAEKASTKKSDVLTPDDLLIFEKKN